MKRLSILSILLLWLVNITAAQTVAIGTQVWSTKNLDVTTFRNGDSIPQATTDAEWSLANRKGQPVWCYHSAPNGAKYGRLYNFYAVRDRRGLAPAGYHIPTEDEWELLADYLGGESVAGKKLKSAKGWGNYTLQGMKPCSNCASWDAEYRTKVTCTTCKDKRQIWSKSDPISGEGSNSSGFSGLPGCLRTQYGHYFDAGERAYFWSATSSYGSHAEAKFLGFSDKLGREEVGHASGMSVRCMKD